MGRIDAPGERGRTIAPRFSPPPRRRGLLSHFLVLQMLAATTKPTGRHRNPPLYCANRRTAPFERDDEDDLDVQANLPTEQPPPSPQARLPRPDADAGGPVDPGATAREGPDAAVRVGTSTSADRVARTLSSGQAFHGERVVVFVAPGAGSAAFVAGRRIGGAVLRNRARRILRALRIRICVPGLLTVDAPRPPGAHLRSRRVLSVRRCLEPTDRSGGPRSPQAAPRPRGEATSSYDAARHVLA